MSAVRRWLFTLLVAICSIAISYLWFDRPVALLIHAQIPHQHAFSSLTHIPDPIMPLAIITFIWIGLWNLLGRPLSKIQVTILLCSISAIMADATKNQLKYIFGRTWPDTWIENNPSLLQDGAYGFHYFHGGEGYASFPSGHSALICAVISVLWTVYPKLRLIYLFVFLAVAIGLVGANYHFLSDIIAGAFVGVSTGWMTTALWHKIRSSA